eukprot:m.65234 g.65234  ORF g.65234 m.65234 type:complete len:627 (-) comp7313_c0_seq1:99-1979(-)
MRVPGPACACEECSNRQAVINETSESDGEPGISPVRSPAGNGGEPSVDAATRSASGDSAMDFIHVPRDLTIDALVSPASFALARSGAPESAFPLSQHFSELTLAQSAGKPAEHLTSMVAAHEQEQSFQSRPDGVSAQSQPPAGRAIGAHCSDPLPCAAHDYHRPLSAAPSSPHRGATCSVAPHVPEAAARATKPAQPVSEYSTMYASPAVPQRSSLVTGTVQSPCAGPILKSAASNAAAACSHSSPLASQSAGAHPRLARSFEAPATESADRVAHHLRTGHENLEYLTHSDAEDLSHSEAEDAAPADPNDSPGPGSFVAAVTAYLLVLSVGFGAAVRPACRKVWDRLCAWAFVIWSRTSALVPPTWASYAPSLPPAVRSACTAASEPRVTAQAVWSACMTACSEPRVTTQAVWSACKTACSKLRVTAQVVWSACKSACSEPRVTAQSIWVLLRSHTRIVLAAAIFLFIVGVISIPTAPSSQSQTPPDAKASDLQYRDAFFRLAEAYRELEEELSSCRRAAASAFGRDCEPRAHSYYDGDDDHGALGTRVAPRHSVVEDDDAPAFATSFPAVDVGQAWDVPAWDKASLPRERPGQGSEWVHAARPRQDPHHVLPRQAADPHGRRTRG